MRVRLERCAIEASTKPGEKVRVVRGPLADHVGIYAGMTARDRVRVMFSMFEREITVELREQDVIAAA
jgi:transcription antitermination factor NusG